LKEDPPDPDPKILPEKFRKISKKFRWFNMKKIWILLKNGVLEMLIREAKKYGHGQLILLHSNGKQKFSILPLLFEKLRDARDKTLVCKNRKPKTSHDIHRINNKAANRIGEKSYT
jgi:hypothetical protein